MDRPTLSQAPVKPYCQARLKLQLGGTVTTEEIWLDYLAHSKRHESSYTKGQFLRILPAVIHEVFGLTKSDDIGRQGTKRGFRGLGLSSASPSDQSEQTFPKLWPDLQPQ